MRTLTILCMLVVLLCAVLQSGIPAQDNTEDKTVTTASQRTPITRIDARIVTGDRPSAGTLGEVFLGIGGREFWLDTSRTDFQSGQDFTYILGEGSNVREASRPFNDPRTPSQLFVEDLDQFPVYIRLDVGEDSEGKEVIDEWNLELAEVTVNPLSDQVQYQALVGPDHLWLGIDVTNRLRTIRLGNYCYLKGVR